MVNFIIQCKSQNMSGSICADCNMCLHRTLVTRTMGGRGDGELPQYYEHLLLLWRTWVPVLTPTWWLTNILNSSFRCSSTLFWPLWVPTTHMVHMQTRRQNPHRGKIINEYFLRNQMNKIIFIIPNKWSVRGVLSGKAPQVTLCSTKVGDGDS